MMSLKGSSNSDAFKDKGKGKAYVSKHSEGKKPSDSMDMECLQRIIKNLSNDITELKTSRISRKLGTTRTTLGISRA